MKARYLRIGTGREIPMANELLNPKTTVWPASLAAATVLGSWALACVFPFAAMATLAALTLNRRAGIALIAAIWATNQFVGFFILSFPWDAQAVGHGVAILGCTLAGFAAARFVAARVPLGSALRSVASLAAAFIVYLVLMRAYAQFGGGAENFTLEINAAVALNDTLWFAGLMALRFALSAVTGEKPLPAATA
jgi:hypothetical protein